ncbi:MAG: Long-chain-fatty-acid--CoA ligase [Pelotomaculum sp. PtaB.Bin013]|uniref:AMP-binding protein n=1 Tax=Pelotomaculum isophthalicicum JI TaxID=947010 RepID=A0A9X4H0K0_9FIRM|nr:AMP-binding protein [Pelotomaculum isophthalicicum]MDF9407341.1 AMP-binding protein [Pelotomaculum isophthalicicum JI]OPX91925.1 MAG: Long-chain-fatty-acid--CoA ligase [Pelotomaculum sp. PtaB.Bin013]
MKSVQDRVQALLDAYPVWPRRTIAGHFDEAVKKYQNRTLVFTLEKEYTYAEMQERSDLLARGLLALGIRPREHVALLMGNYPEFIISKLALTKIGAVCVPLNTMLLERELAFLLEDSDVVALIFNDSLGKNNYVDIIGRICSELTVQPDGINVSCAALPRLRNVICFSANDSIYDDLMSFNDLYRLGEGISPDELQRVRQATEYPDDICDIMYTSGTTSLPKGAMMSHDMLLRSSYAACLTRAVEDGRRIYFPLPLYHIFAYELGLLVVTFVGGAIVTHAQFTPREALELMEKSRANDFLCVPSILLAVLNHPDLKKHDLSSLHATMCGATPAPVPLWQRAVDELNLQEMCAGYGMTEVSGASTITSPGDPVEVMATRVGRLVMANCSGLPEFGNRNIQYKVVDPFTGKELPPGEEGEWVCRGNMVTRGYYKRPQENVELIDKDGWLRTGDLGIIHPDGLFQITGRSKEIYKISGENVSPKEVEEVISTHPKVNQVYVLGVPDRNMGEVGVAFIELKPGEESTRREIVGYCKGKLARFKIPHHIFFTSSSELPFTSSGKIKKYKLAERALSLLEKDGKKS